MKKIKIILLFISVKKKRRRSNAYNVGMFVFEHQSLSCLLNCSATVTGKMISCIKSFDCLRVSNLNFIWFIWRLVIKKKRYPDAYYESVVLMFSSFSLFDKLWCTFFFSPAHVCVCVCPMSLVSVRRRSGSNLCCDMKRV